MKLKLDTLFVGVLAVAAMTGCERRQAMYNQPKLNPYEKNDFFADGRNARQPVPGTVARGALVTDEQLMLGTAGGKLADTYPFPITKAVLERGAERYKIYCTPCHAPQGNGLGMVVRRGFQRPPSFHLERLRAAPVGHFYSVITQGIGQMNGYAAQVQKPEDRWAIVAYVRALQFSQNATISDVPDDIRPQLAEVAEGVNVGLPSEPKAEESHHGHH